MSVRDVDNRSAYFHSSMLGLTDIAVLLYSKCAGTIPTNLPIVDEIDSLEKVCKNTEINYCDSKL